jgi:hypothetical protein
MGEYANYNGQQIKIGTCEDMYYLRFQQRHEVTSLSGNVDLEDPSILQELRFRFPFPEEDSIEPGAFEDHNKSARVPDTYQPSDIEHRTVQFSARNGYLVSLPCPESAEGHAFPHTIHRNGHGGAVHLVAQKLVGSELWAVCRCGGCGSMWRLPKVEGLELAGAFMSHAASLPENDSRRQYHHTIARRILDGYTHPAI